MSVVHLEKPKPQRRPMLVARALLGQSFSRPASGVANITGSDERDSWLMAVGIDFGDSG
jgi:hypothetical protein